MTPENFQGSIVEAQKTATVRTLFEIEPKMIDHNGHASSGEINHLFELAQVDGLLAKSFFGDPKVAIEALSTTIFIKKQTIVYHIELRMGDRGDIETSAVLGDSSITFSQAMYNARRELVAEATYVVVTVDKERKAAPIPPNMRAALLKTDA